MESDPGLEFLTGMFEQHSSNSQQDEDVFYFETDYLPLKTNLDYLKLLRTLAILHVQRIKLTQDIDKLTELKMKVEVDPEAVKNEILNGKAPFLSRSKIEEVPEIDWSKYKSLDFDGKLSLTTRRMAKQDGKQQHLQSHSNDVQSTQDGKIRVRGRLYTENKPETFNQLWTVEEQLRLEALLIEFPPEPIESRRWKKIADALGNRTTKQVCSRVQKYFKKLQKAGIAIPGRPGKPWKYNKPNRINKQHKHLLYKPTTFFPGAAIKDLGGSGGGGSTCGDNTDSDDCDDFSSLGGDILPPSALSQSDSISSIQHWTETLTHIKKEKEEITQQHHNQVRHYGFMCLSCGESPIIGTRWECSSCLKEGGTGGDSTVSMCSNCLAQMVDSSEPVHPLSHAFIPHRTFTNPQYKAQNLGNDNYLDPNFVV